MQPRLTQHLLYTFRDWFLLLQRVHDHGVRNRRSGLQLRLAR